MVVHAEPGIIHVIYAYSDTKINLKIKWGIVAMYDRPSGSVGQLQVREIMLKSFDVGENRVMLNNSSSFTSLTLIYRSSSGSSSSQKHLLPYLSSHCSHMAEPRIIAGPSISIGLK